MIAHAGAAAPKGALLLEELVGDSPASLPAPVPSSVPRSVTFRWLHDAHGPRGRTVPGSLVTPGVLSSRIPLRPRRTTMICAPLSAPWGHLHLLLALRLGSTILLHDRFDPLHALVSIDEHGPDALALLPEMLAEIMSLPRETLAWYDTSAVRVIAVRDRELAGDLAIPAIARFGAILYSLRGPSIIALSPQSEPSLVALAGPARIL